MGEEVPPGNGEKCSDARSTTVVRNVRAGTSLLSESWNLFGQVEPRNYQGSPPAPPPPPNVREIQSNNTRNRMCPAATNRQHEGRGFSISLLNPSPLTSIQLLQG